MGEEITVREIIQMSPLRSIIAERMTLSLREMAQVTLMRESIVNGLVEYRKKVMREIEDKAGVKVTFTDILVKLVSTLLKRHPLLNSSLVNGEIRVYEDVNVGVAVAIDHGLVVPVVKKVDEKSLAVVSKEIKELSEKARKGTLTFDDVSGGTFTISNLGMFGVDSFTPIINPPQSAILGVGKIAVKPVVIGDDIVKAHVAWLSLTFDHRVMDGHTAALFLDDLAKALEDANSVGSLIGRII